jgi:hypothetical protein
MAFVESDIISGLRIRPQLVRAASTIENIFEAASKHLERHPPYLSFCLVLQQSEGRACFPERVEVVVPGVEGSQHVLSRSRLHPGHELHNRLPPPSQRRQGVGGLLEFRVFGHSRLVLLVGHVRRRLPTLLFLHSYFLPTTPKAQSLNVQSFASLLHS